MEHEKAGEYETAAECYRLGLSYEPGDRFCAYFLHNNYGFCLNVLGQHADAEWYCRTAIELDPSRPNAFKNLGISLEARGEYEPAIEAWITGTRVCPEDPRSLGHLERLLEEQPHLERGLELGTAIEDCRRAVGQAAAVRVGRGRGTR